MPQDENPENDQIFETQQKSAGFAQRPAPPDPFGASTGSPVIPRELTPEELDAMQDEISVQRRGGPPLPEGEEAAPSGFGLAAEEAAARRAEPTDVKEPSK